MIRLVQSFHRPDLKIWRWAASWPRNPNCVMMIASTAALISCHQLSPIQMNASTQAVKMARAPISLVQ
jgi:hypothetical protein